MKKYITKYNKELAAPQFSKIYTVDYFLFLLMLWGPPKIFGVDPFRTPEYSMQYELDRNSVFEIAVWLFIGARILSFFLYNFFKKKPILTSGLFKGATGFYFLYAIVALSSMLYSPSPLLSGFRAYQVLACLLYITILVSSENSSAKFINIFFIFFASKTIYNFIMFFIEPSIVGADTPDGYRLLGGFPFNRDFGLAAAITICFCLSRLIQKQNINIHYYIYYYALLTISIFVLLMSRVRGAILAVLISVFLTSLLLKKFRLKILFTTILMVALFYGFGFDKEIFAFIVRNPDTFWGMSMRTETWNILWPKVLEKPFIGYGFAVGSRIALSEWWMRGIRIGDAHNSWMEALISVGIMGTLALMLSSVFAFYYIQKLKKDRKELYILLNLLILFVLLVSITSNVLSYASPLFAIIVAYSQKRFS